MEATERGSDTGWGSGSEEGVRHKDLPNAIIIKIIHEVQKSRAKDLNVHREKMEKKFVIPSAPMNTHSLKMDIEMWRCPSCRARCLMSSRTCFKCCEPNPEKDYTFSSL